MSPSIAHQSVPQAICSTCDRPLADERHYAASGQHVLCALRLTLSYCLGALASCDQAIATTRRVDMAALSDAYAALNSGIQAYRRAVTEVPR